MDLNEFKDLILNIVKQAQDLKDKYLPFKDAPVNYACIFCQNKNEYSTFNKLAKDLGSIIKETNTGPIYLLTPPLKTSAGTLRLLKIRMPDPTRPERGDANFTFQDFEQFKKKALKGEFGGKFSLIERENFVMLELTDPSFNIRTYFSHPTLETLLGI